MACPLLPRRETSMSSISADPGRLPAGYCIGLSSWTSQFRTVDWPGYREFGNYARVALFPEHPRPADPQSPGVVNFAQAIASETAPGSSSPIVDIAGDPPGMGPQRVLPVMARCRRINRLVQRLLEVMVRS